MKLILLLAVFFCSYVWKASAQHDQHNTTKADTRGKDQRKGGIIEYHLYVNDTTVNFTGRRRRALAINGQIPAPTLRFTEGDSAVIHVHNQLKGEVSIHWHGVLLPNEEDGVHVLNTPPIHAGEHHTFRFRVIQHGTLWYHSHTKFQEQEGLYGPLVFDPATPDDKRPRHEEILQLSDWRNERGSSIIRSLKRRNEWYAIQKKSVQSWGEAVVKGHFGDKVQMEWTRMPGADVSDIYYPVHLMHGLPERTFSSYKKGDSLVLRIINGSAATYYWLQYAGGKMKVIAADGNNVQPVEVDKLLIATAETYDIIIKLPDNGQYEFRATAQDITKSTSAYFGSGQQVKASDIPPLDYMVLMNEMNKMTWMMKGMGMKMRMGLFMKMDMSAMNDMQGMDHGTMPDKMEEVPSHEGHNMTDSNEKEKPALPNHQMPMKEHAAPATDTTVTHPAGHNKMPDMQQTKKPVKKQPGPKTREKTPKKKKPAPKKKAPVKKEDHSQHGGMSFTAAEPFIVTEIAGSTESMETDTVPMSHNMGAQHSGGKQKTSPLRDTTRSYMLQTMMPKTPMTGFDFPPGNGKEIVLSYDMLVSDSGTTSLPVNRSWREIELTLSGNMQRFVWSINGKTLSQQDAKVMIRRGENVRVIFTNATMMEHPIHLHGHFFRLINSQGKMAPMKHTFNINAMHTQVIEFAATEEKDWFLHCHTLYHMIAGMATIFSYEGTVSEVQQSHPREFRQFKREHGSLLFPWANAGFHSQSTFGTIVLSGLKFQLDQDWRWNYKKSYELETRGQYFLDKRQFFSAFIGAEFEQSNMRTGKEQAITEKENLITAGLIYTLPFLINAEGRVDHKGNVRFQLRREDLPLTTRTRLDVSWNTDKEYAIAARYILSKFLALSANYDSDYGWGAGLSLIY